MAVSESIQTCPRCGAALPEAASFCPYCAQEIRPRETVKFPAFPHWRKVLRWAAALAALAALAVWLFCCLTPNTYDAYGALTYTDRDGTYQLLVSFHNNRFTPEAELTEHAEETGEYRIPSRLFINHVDSGANAGQIFLQKVEWSSTELIQPEDSPSPMVCSQPEYRSFSPEAAQVSLVDYTGQSSPAELLWTLRMKNGDTIRLRQKIRLERIETYDYYPEDYPMETVEELQALVDQIIRDVPAPDVVNLHLPPVTYDGGLTISGRSMNLYGSADNAGRRTTFTDTVQVSGGVSISYCYDIDFIGGGDGVGVSASARFRAENCAFRGWKTGVLAYGEAWVNVIGCTFEENGIGFHFNSTGGSVNHTMYNDNRFLRNGTAVLLENVPTEETLNFQGSQFIGNDTDIDNRCKRSLKISQAIFK